MFKKWTRTQPLLILILLFSFWVILNNDTHENRCIKLSGYQKNECVMSLVDKFLDKRRVDYALAFLNKYQIKDKNFYATDCHGVAHYIGDQAFALHKQGYRLDYGKYTNICVYGFYHAFTSSFILLGEFDRARDFCGGLEKKSNSSAPSCYHGIGHGAIYNFYEDFGIRDPEEIIDRSVELCQKVLDKDYKLNECLSGVYDGIGDVVLKSEYTGLTPDIIFGYCTNQPKKYKPNCYAMIAHLVYRKTKISFSELVKYVLVNPKVEDKPAAISGLSLIYIVDLKDGNIDEGVSVCKNLPLNLKVECFKSMGYKLADDEVTGKHYEAIKGLCSNHLLTDTESRLCFELGVQTMFIYYKKDELKGLCNSETVDIFKTTCLNQLND